MGSSTEIFFGTANVAVVGSEPTRRAVLQAGAAACCLAATGACDAGPGEPYRRGRVTLGEVESLRRELSALPARVKYLAKQRLYLALWEPAIGKAATYPDAAAGFLALSQRCPHLGCRIPLCESSQWFECPCHGSRFNRVGEYKYGPAPTGLARMALSTEKQLDGLTQLVVDTERPVTGAERGTLTIQEDEPTGPHCVG